MELEEGGVCEAVCILVLSTSNGVTGERKAILRRAISDDFSTNLEMILDEKTCTNSETRS